MVEARRLLLDALEALAPIAPALVLGGGQAVDLRVPRSALPVLLSTRDADLTLDVVALSRPAPVGALLRRAGLAPAKGTGHWARAGNRLLRYLARGMPIHVDVMVPDEAWPESVAGPDPRPQGDASTMPPMVVTLLDDSPLAVPSLEVPSREGGDPRRPTVRVAGTASLLLTKVNKFEARRLRALARGRPFSTIPAKDVLDVVRLLVAGGDDLEHGVLRIRSHPRGARVAAESLAFLGAHFAREDGLGTSLARDALAAHRADSVLRESVRRAAALAAAARLSPSSR